MSFLAIVNNGALLLALTMGYILVARHLRMETLAGKLLGGLLFGLAAIGGMLNAFVLSPGVIFDGRSVMVSLASLLLGPTAGLIAAATGSAYRLSLGGPGAFTGVLSLLSSAAVGSAFHFLRKRRRRPLTAGFLLLFGFLVHLLVLAVIYLTLPAPLHLEATRAVALPFLTVLPLVTMLAGLLIHHEEQRLDLARDLAASQESLAKNHALLKSLLDSIPDLIFYKDTNSVYLGCNQAFEKFAGRQEEEIKGKTDLDLFPAGLAEFFRAKDREVLALCAPSRNEEWVTYPDGRQVLLDTLKTPYLGPDGRVLGLIGISRDITELRRAEQAASENARLLNEVFQSIQDGICVLSRDMTIIKANQALERMYPAKVPLAGKRCFEAFHDRASPCSNCPSMRAMENKRLERSLVDYPRPDGTQGVIELFAFPMRDSSGEITGVVEYVRDITERQRNQMEKELAMERFQTLVDALDALVYVADMETYEILFINAYGKKVWGEITGKLCWQTLQEGQTGPCPFCTNDRLVDKEGNPTGTYVWEFQNTVTRHWYECRDQAIRWTDGRLVRMEIATDITRRKLAEFEQQTLESQLRQAQKMEAIGTLAGGIAHDFNNLLVPIIGYAEMLMAGEPEGSDKRRDLGEILKAAQRARDLVKQILTFSRQTEHERKPIIVGPVLKECLKLLRASLPSNIEIRQEIRAANAKVLGDPTQLTQLVMNLCTNAFHAMEEKGGTLSLVLDEAEIDQQQGTPLGLPPGRYLKLEVGDTGSGIDPQVLERIFDPYFTTKGEGRGTGLGLAVVQGIVKAYKGGIRVESKVGQGSRFTLFFPLLQGEEPDVSSGVVGGELPMGKNEHILLVDDEEPVLTSTRRLLEFLGYRVTAESSPVTALEIFQQAPWEYDLVITDVTMPQMTGDHLVEAIRRVRPEIPALLITGFSSMVDNARAAALGVQGLLLKPLLRTEVAKAVRRALDARQG